MLKAIIITAIFSLPSVALAQKNINVGMGVLNVDFEKQPTLNFYSDTSQLKPSKTVSVIKDIRGEFVIKNDDKALAWFKPEGLWLDYSIFIIRVDTNIGMWHRVIVNNDEGTTLWLKGNSFMKFIKWQKFLVEETTSIDKHPDFLLDIKTLPSDSAPTIKKIQGSDCFEAFEVKGDWLRIRTNTVLDCNESKKVISSGWIRWRQNNRLTIRYGVSC